MSLRNRFVLPAIALLSLAFLISCGSNSTPVKPPPNGSFGNGNLKGTYAFAVAGQDLSGGFIAIGGTFSADGNGGINGGSLTANDSVSSAMFSGQPITGGSYKVGIDGRPASSGSLLVLQTSAATFVFDFVLTSSEHGQITLFDPNNGTGSGTFDLQSTVTQANVDGQSYAFNVSGAIFNGSTEYSYASVGAFSLDASGNIVTTTAVTDLNENGGALCGIATSCAMTGGSVNLSAVPGKLTFSTASQGSFDFDVYPVDATHLKLVETDVTPLPVMLGDAFTQSTSLPTGNTVFTVAGWDSSGAGGPFTAAGIIDFDSSGNVKSDSVEDINDVGTAIEVGSVVSASSTIAGSASALTNGRSVLTLTGFVNGNNAANCTDCQFAAYPSSDGLQLLEVDGGGSTNGVAYTQSATTLTSSTSYGLNLSGNNGAEEDDIAQFTYNGSAFTAGHVDFNSAGSTTFGLTFTCNFAPDSTVASRGIVKPTTNGYNLVTYAVDASTVAFVETDNNQVGIGSFVSQNANASSNAAARHLVVMRATSGPRQALKKRH